MNALTLNRNEVSTTIGNKLVKTVKVASTAIFFGILMVLASAAMILYADNVQLTADLNAERQSSIVMMETLKKVNLEKAALERELIYEKGNGCVSRAVDSVGDGIAAVGAGIASAAGYVAGGIASAIDYVKE